MSLLTPLWMEDQTYSATQDRELIDSLFSSAGIIGPGDLLVAQRAAGANMSVDVAAGTCVVTGTDVSGQGKYLCKSNAVTNITIATAPSTGNSRIDLVVAKVRDEDAIGGANNDWIIEAITGTPATTGTEVAPSAPASSLVLAQVLVGPTVSTIVTANITDLRATVNDTGWVPITAFTNGYSQDGSYPATAYKILNGVVFVRFYLNMGTFGDAAFTLPSACRPSQDLYMPGGGNDVNQGALTAIVPATGAVIILAQESDTPGPVFVGLLTFPLG